MKAKVTNVSAWQGTPTGGTLDVELHGRYVDSDGNATVSHYSAVLDVPNKRWVDPDTGAELWLVVQGPDDPPGPKAVFTEVLAYGATKAVRTTFTRKLVSSDLAGLYFDYAEPSPVNPDGFGDAPLTMQAARQLLEQAPILEQGAALVRAAMGISGTVSTPAGLPPGAAVDTRYLVESTGTIWLKTAGGWTDTHYSASNIRFGTRAQRLLFVPSAAMQWAETDTGLTLTYIPGIGWRDAYGGDPDAAPPPPDTGGY
ncbi:hypothetical protein DAETH_48020 (plasmid) [Deinococcus aetherius]|uniref:Minor tail protein n=1 Tax=Deinococcus aetherius TaxID=200252 RepID=A0ABM8ALX5_9DEIO|nr:hypothetical protein [Deinococcus aetherius]BDP44833.1 hypothetical protein DAETH_48020 [Deinococcus aetherius]